MIFNNLLYIMQRSVLFTWCILLIGIYNVYAQVEIRPTYREPYRPVYHFTPPVNWTNDPNGLVFAAGLYHLFYQYNPEGMVWGHMSWGHAVSKDLVHWQNWPVAIPEGPEGMIFSGSAVVDSFNTSGLGTAAHPPLVAIYTSHHIVDTAHTDLYQQSQHIAYSLDGGHTWRKFAHNPVLDLHMRDFRDPKVWWYAPDHVWMMVVSFPVAHQVQFFRSSDLIHWQHTGTFGPAGDTSYVWECPDLFPLQIYDATGKPTGKSKWVLMVSVQYDVQYFIGDFDGRTFTADDIRQIRKVDEGRDFYAATTYNDIPATDGRRICIAWMDNWAYAAHVPTFPWRGFMTVPRVFTLRENERGIPVLYQYPVDEIEQLAVDSMVIVHRAVKAKHPLWVHDYPFTVGKLSLQLRKIKGSFRLAVAQHGDTAVWINYHPGTGKLQVDRTHSGNTHFDSRFPSVTTVQLRPAAHLRLDVYLDKSSVEIFVNGGEKAITLLFFPDAHQTEVSLEAMDGSCMIDTLKLIRYPQAAYLVQRKFVSYGSHLGH